MPAEQAAEPLGVVAAVQRCRDTTAALGPGEIGAAGVLFRKQDRVRGAVPKRGREARHSLWAAEFAVLVHHAKYLGVAGVTACAPRLALVVFHDAVPRRRIGGAKEELDRGGSDPGALGEEEPPDVRLLEEIVLFEIGQQVEERVAVASRSVAGKPADPGR
jgi:hypothetical protein